MTLTKTCSVADCYGQFYARGWCTRHYQRWLKYGDPQAPTPPRRRKTHCVVGHRLSGRNIRIYRYGNVTQRQCVKCNRRQMRLSMRRRRSEGKVPRLTRDQARDYMRRYRAEVRSGIRIPKPHTVDRQTRWTLTDTISDLLEIEGSWWTAPEIAQRLEAELSSVRKTLHRLGQSGVLVKRSLGDGRMEWKAL